MARLVTMPKYEAYKDSNVDWLDRIPVNWSEEKLKFLAKIDNSGEYGADPELKALNYPVATTAQITSDGLFLVEEMPIRGFSPQEVSRYLCKASDILVVKSSGSISNVISGKVGFFNENTEPFVFSNFLLRIRSNQKKVVARYIYYLLTSNLTKERVKRMVTGSTYPNLQVPEYVGALMPLPPCSEQVRIVNFLDRKTTQIDQVIAIKDKQIALLKERKQILIQNAVTRGLDPNVPMKDSGVEWIGEIPEHWFTKRLKYILEERNERSKTGEEPLFMVSQVHGLVVRSECHEKAEVAESNIDNKIVHKNDLVFNKLKAHLGVFFKSNIDYEGLVSPDYAVYKKKAYIDDLKFLEILFRHPVYIAQFIIRATGIVEGLIRLYTDDLFDISVGVPPKEEQKNILKYIEIETNKYDKAIALQQKQIEKLKEYKSTLINSAVTGKIKVA